MTDCGRYITSTGDNIQENSIGTGESFNFNISESDSFVEKYFDFTDNIQISEFTLFWENAPKGSVVDIDVVESDGHVKSRILINKSLYGSNIYGQTKKMIKPFDVDQGHRLKVVVKNSSDPKFFEFWGEMNILRNVTIDGTSL